MVSVDEIRSVAGPLPRTEERLVRERITFRIRQIVYLSVAPDESSMGFAFPKEERSELVAAEPTKFFLPVASDLRFNWVRVWLAAIDEVELREIVVPAWSMVAPKRVVAEYFADHGIRAKCLN
jgi:hypothetical protein